ncbi:MAG: hypothetical protein EBS01_01780 [Verrucomicrobia bacterium]|nr:hypothetical protein [Verrucomicrobiota bacterium]
MFWVLENPTVFLPRSVKVARSVFLRFEGNPRAVEIHSARLGSSPTGQNFLSFLAFPVPWWSYNFFTL